MSRLRQLHADARAIFEGALRACDVDAAMERHLRFEGKTLIRPLAGSGPISLDDYDEVLVIALGKAAVPMTRALLKRLPKGVPVRGVCAGAAVPARGDARVRWFKGGHPLPNEESFAAAREALELLREAGVRTLVIFLVSGGGSAMMELPRDAAIELEELLEFHRALVGSGATIAEINAVRRQFSAVKGGRLAMAAGEAKQLTLLLADVPVKDVEAVASSPTLPDRGGEYECREILDRYGLMERFPRRVREWFESRISSGAEAPSSLQRANGRAKARPLHGLTPAHFKVERIPAEAVPLQNRGPAAWGDYEVLLSNEDLVAAACEQARRLGYETVVDNSCDDWDYEEACGYLLRRFRELRREMPWVCLVSGGEVTVKLEGAVGRGGRNQHFALEAAVKMDRNADEEMVVLSAGSDGVDGNGNAAGAISDGSTVARARELGVEAKAALTRFDSGTVFAALGDAIVTGPTGNNLRDLRLVLGSLREVRGK